MQEDRAVSQWGTVSILGLDPAFDDVRVEKAEFDVKVF